MIRELIPGIRQDKLGFELSTPVDSVKIQSSTIVLWGASLLASVSGVAFGGSDGEPTSASFDEHWAFQAPERPAVPGVENGDWVRNPVDAFVLSRLEDKEVTPSPPADRRTLIRRLYLDLLGLLPSREEVEAFVRDSRPDAYEHWVDRLLASPHFGEHWGRYWLDLARYADSDGYEKDRPRPYAYLYRDWVIEAINRDLPLDQFSIQQLAGDLLPDSTLEQKKATGFHRNTLKNTEGGVDQEEFRAKALADRVSTTGEVWMGLTLGCAECHDHKYDPVSQKEFYQVYAFFNRAMDRDIPAPRPDELAAYQAAKKAWEEKEADLNARIQRYTQEELPCRQTEWIKDLRKNKEADQMESLPEQIVRIVQLPADQRSESQQSALNEFYREIDPGLKELKEESTELSKQKPEYPPTKVRAIGRNPDPPQTHVHIRGDFLRKGDSVEPGMLSVLPPMNARGTVPDRLDLARWLFEPDHPLTGRVAANRLWQHLFGHGLVRTPNDFGTRGEEPTHPELLDWLATEYPRRNWSRKSMIRLIVTSAAYRQSSHHRPELQSRDPNNRWVARQNRFRLPAEAVRDIYLDASGLLATEVGGPGIRPPLPDDIAALGYANSVKWRESQGADKYRRGLYIFRQRTVPYPMLVQFDAPEGNVACTRRERSNTPLQALTLLNDPVFFECARALGRRMAQHRASAPEKKIERVFERCLSRQPTSRELDRLVELYEQNIRSIQKQPARAARIAGIESDSMAPELELIETAALIGVARTVLNVDEFITRE